jgi:hypothetical protein
MVGYQGVDDLDLVTGTPISFFDQVEYFPLF